MTQYFKWQVMFELYITSVHLGSETGKGDVRERGECTRFYSFFPLYL